MNPTNEPEAEEWRSCEAEKPTVYLPVKVMLEDGSEHLGFWSGSAWVAAGMEVLPLLWRPRQ